MPPIAWLLFGALGVLVASQDSDVCLGHPGSLPFQQAKAANPKVSESSPDLQAVKTHRSPKQTPAPPSPEQWRRYQQVQRHMGTQFSIQLYAASKSEAAAAYASIDRRVAQIEQAMSDYRPTSEIRRLSAQAAEQPRVSGPMPISCDVRTVLLASRQIGVETEGAFDVSVAPLTRIWRRSRRNGKLPDPELLRAAQKHVGPTKWSLADQGVVMTPGVYFDLGGIAKGFALDEAVAAAAKLGIRRILVDGGGDIVAGDPPPGRDAWKIGVAPLEAGGKPKWVVPLANQAIATSGDAWQFFEVDGRRYSHLIDPRTGQAVEGRHSVTVVAPSGLIADAWASAVCVLGPKRGLDLLAKRQAEAGAIVTTLDPEGKPQQAVSASFKKRAAKAP